MYEYGSRVGAVMDMSQEEGKARLFGYGVYEGDYKVGDEESDPMPVGDVAELSGVLGGEVMNPRIRLDNGDVVWGCECWWGPEDAVKRTLEDYEVEMVDIKQKRVEVIASNFVHDEVV